MPITQHAPTLALTLGMALVYLVVVRLVDLNEKEPLWAVGMLFILGALGACVLGLGVNMAVLELHVVPAVLAKELARFIAIAAGVGVLSAVAARRGWSEINGLMDGVVYGAAGGLGFATGDVLIHDVVLGSLSSLGELGSWGLSLRGAGSAALIGLSDGVFGALMGIGFAAAVYATVPLQRFLFPVCGYLAAVLAHASYEILGRGNALGGSEGVLRRWSALILPVLVVVVVMVVALAQEKRAIQQQLVTEADTGVVTPDELGLLQSVLAREVLYVKTLWRSGFGRWAALRDLHNRQVQLALAKHRMAAGSAAEAPGGASAEVQQLRAAVVELKNSLEHDAQVALPEPTAASLEPAPGRPAAEPLRVKKVRKRDGLGDGKPDRRAKQSRAIRPRDKHKDRPAASPSDRGGGARRGTGRGKPGGGR